MGRRNDVEQETALRACRIAGNGTGYDREGDGGIAAGHRARGAGMGRRNDVEQETALRACRMAGNGTGYDREGDRDGGDEARGQVSV